MKWWWLLTCSGFALSIDRVQPLNVRARHLLNNKQIKWCVLLTPHWHLGWTLQCTLLALQRIHVLRCIYLKQQLPNRIEGWHLYTQLHLQCQCLLLSSMLFVLDYGARWKGRKNAKLNLIRQWMELVVMQERYDIISDICGNCTFLKFLLWLEFYHLVLFFSLILIQWTGFHLQAVPSPFSCFLLIILVAGLWM